MAMTPKRALSLLDEALRLARMMLATQINPAYMEGRPTYLRSRGEPIFETAMVLEQYSFSIEALQGRGVRSQGLSIFDLTIDLLEELERSVLNDPSMEVLSAIPWTTNRLPKSATKSFQKVISLIGYDDPVVPIREALIRLLVTLRSEALEYSQEINFEVDLRFTKGDLAKENIRLKRIVPAQSISPVTFEIVRGTLTIKHQVSKPPKQDLVSIADARETISLAERRIIEELEQ